MKTRPPSKGPTIPPERPAASKTPPPRVSVDGKRWHEQQASSPAPTLVSQIAEGFARAAIGAIGSLSLTDVTARIGAQLRPYRHQPPAMPVDDGNQRIDHKQGTNALKFQHRPRRLAVRRQLLVVLDHGGLHARGRTAVLPGDRIHHRAEFGDLGLAQHVGHADQHRDTLI